MIFGRYSMIFCGDFCKLPPMKANKKHLSYENSCHWENCNNVAIVLNNSHRLRDDPEYGGLLK
jgi:hypothetical protein